MRFFDSTRSLPRSRLALNLFRADKSRSISLPRKLKTAAYNPAYLASALKLREI